MRVPLFGADVLNTACVVAVWVCGFLPMCFVCDYCDCVCVCVKRFCVCVCVCLFLTRHVLIYHFTLKLNLYYKCLLSTLIKSNIPFLIFQYSTPSFHFPFPVSFSPPSPSLLAFALPPTPLPEITLFLRL